MAFPTITVTAGSGTTINTLPNAGQATMSNSLPVALASDQGALSVSGTFWQATQPVSLATAIATNADGTITAGTAPSKSLIGGGIFNSSPITLTTGQGAALQVDANGLLKVTGTFWQTTQPISAASLPLPSGAATAAKQPALGTAGTASSDVLSVQGIASGTALGVSLASLPALATGSNVIGAVTQSGTWNVGTITTLPAIPAGANTIGAVNLNSGTATIGGVVIKPTATSGGQTLSRVTAAATTNATNLKASAGNIIRIAVFNTAAYTVFLKLYNKASAPTVGTDTPTRTIPIPASTGFSEEYVYGRPDATGISYAITKLQADSDTTAVVAGDLIGEISWI
jgi:hypothetical protein